MKVFGFVSILTLLVACQNTTNTDVNTQSAKDSTADSILQSSLPPVIVALDTALYQQKLLELVHQIPTERWPVQTELPNPGALLPFNRIVAFYGNLYSKGMGILGALPPDKMLAELQKEVHNWEQADTLTSVIPALHYIAVTAQASPGAGRKYRLRMPFTQIDKILEMAKKIGAIVILDIQVGHSTLQEEIPQLEKYLSMPDVHLGIDPEFSMKNGKVPSSSIGTFDAEDINYATEYLSQLVSEYHLPPKILIVHRFTKGMLTNYKNIKTLPDVQIVMDMDGFGFPAKKISTYNLCIEKEPVQFTGFKIFYENDTEDKRWPAVMKPSDVLSLCPAPVYIQYQ